MSYEYQDFSKRDKANLREILALGAKREVEHFLKESLPDHKLLLEERFEDILGPYWKLANKFKDFSKHLTRKYDNYSHREIPYMLAGLLYDKHLTQKDIEHFSEAGREKLNEMIEAVARMRE